MKPKYYMPIKGIAPRPYVGLWIFEDGCIGKCLTEDGDFYTIGEINKNHFTDKLDFKELIRVYTENDVSETGGYDFIMKLQKDEFYTDILKETHE